MSVELTEEILELGGLGKIPYYDIEKVICVQSDKPQYFVRGEVYDVVGRDEEKIRILKVKSKMGEVSISVDNLYSIGSIYRWTFLPVGHLSDEELFTLKLML